MFDVYFFKHETAYEMRISDWSSDVCSSDYTAAEYPVAVVQISIVAALHDWGVWQGEAHPLEAELLAGMGRFYDPKLKTLRRYLPNVGDDKNADAVDSWYLYHPLLNLGKLALAGNARAKRLFLKSIDYGIRADRKSVV